MSVCMGLPLGITALVFLLQLTIAVTSCFVWVVNIQESIGKNNLPNLLDWLQIWDGVGKKLEQAMFSRPESASWIKRRAFLQLTAFLEWCSIHYLSCLVFCLISQASVVVMARRKWLSSTSFSCLLWIILLLNSWKRMFCIFNVLLSGFTCCVCLHLFLMCSVGNKIFGQIKKRKKMPKLETQREVQEKDVHQTTENFGVKLKLPEELMFADERDSLDENVGSLSLGPPANKRKQDEATGSWFRSNLCERTGERILAKDTESTIGNTLIWPAKFQLNGISLHSRNKAENGHLEMKKNTLRDAQEFSDDEVAPFSDDNKEKEKRFDRLQDEVKEDRGEITSMKTCNMLHVVLVCSLALNCWLVWLFKDVIRQAFSKT